MAKAMQRTNKVTKRERQRAAAEGRAIARRKQARRRSLAYGLGAVGLLTVIVLALLAFMGQSDGGGATAIVPSRQGEVTVSGEARAAPLGRGEVAPSFTAPGFRVLTDTETGEATVRRQDVSWSSGAPTVLSIWAPWCPHCQVELPVLARVARDHPDVAFLTIVTAIGDSPGPDAGAFMADNGITMPTAIDDAQGTLAAAFGIQGFPTLYFVGSDGAVTQMAEGEVDEEELSRIVGSLT